MQTRHGGVETIPAGEGFVSLAVHRVQAEVDPRKPCRQQIRQLLRQSHAVRREHDLLDPGNAFQHFYKNRQLRPHQRLPAGQAYLADAQFCGFCHHCGDLLIAQDVLVRHQRNALRRHAVPAAQIAAVGDRDTQIFDCASVLIFHGAYARSPRSDPQLPRNPSSRPRSGTVWDSPNSSGLRSG